MIVVYHKSCYDGFTAAWLIWRNLSVEVREKTKFVACQYGEEFPFTHSDLKDQDVIVADFSFPRLQLELIADVAKSLIVLDHHKTAQADLEGLPYCKFDMSKSGARLVQEYLKCPSNWIVDYTEDRDLWLHKLPSTKEINARLRMVPFNFEAFEEIHKRPLSTIVNEGKLLLEYEEKLIESAVSKAEEVELAGYKVLKVNTTVLHSEIGNRLCYKSDGTIRPFAITYFCNEKEVVVSLRSTDQGVDVSEIARKFGGGGHRNAAGFKLKAKAINV